MENINGLLTVWYFGDWHLDLIADIGGIAVAAAECSRHTLIISTQQPWDEAGCFISAWLPAVSEKTVTPASTPAFAGLLSAMLYVSWSPL